jgi:hypothetical protein
MLPITDLKAKIVSDVNLGRLVAFERGSQRLFALRVNAGRDVTPESAALLVFGLQDGGQTFPAVYLSNVGHEWCMVLNVPLLVGAEVSPFLSGRRSPGLAAGALIAHENGLAIAAATPPLTELHFWDIQSGLPVRAPEASQQLTGWQIGVAGIDGKFVPIIPG